MFQFVPRAKPGQYGDALAVHRRTELLIWAAALVLVASGAAYYSHRIVKWLAYDDEGGYLYAAWRIGLGEVPYRDFLTPQLPLFLYPGALVLRFSGNAVLAVRLYMTTLALGAAFLLFLTVRDLGDWRVALVALPLVMVQQEFYWAGRFFRPEAPMLFWQMLGVYLFVRGYARRRRGLLALSGLCLGLAMMAKLFGALAAAGLGLFLLVEGIRGHESREALGQVLWFGLPFLAIVSGIGMLFLRISPDFLAAVVGHHLKQGSGTPLLEVMRKGLVLYRDFAVAQPAYAALAVAGLLLSLWRLPRAARVFAYQVPTASAFLLMTRGLQARHLTYLVPALGVGAAMALVSLGTWLSSLTKAWPLKMASYGLMLGLGIAALWPHWVFNRWVASWEEHDTQAWVEYVQAETAPDEVVVSDYPGINFFARRKTTPLAAGISRGAATSGQIMGRDLIREIESYDASMVFMNVAQGAHQFALLLDYPAFKAYVQEHFFLVGRRRYDYRLMEVYAAEDLWPGDRLDVDFGHQLGLTGMQWLNAQAEPGERLQLELRWRALGPMPADYWVTLRLMDERGHEWGLGSKRLVDIDRETYWDERGLERPVLTPTSRWPQGEVTLQAFELPVDMATPAGQYRVWLRVHPVTTWAGLPILTHDETNRGYDLDLAAATVELRERAADPASLAIEQPLQALFGSDVEVVGLDVVEAARPGDRLEVAIYWRSLKDLERLDARMALRLVGKGRAISELNTPLLGSGPYGARWPQGEILKGQYTLPVPAEIEPGSYALEVALVGGSGIGSSVRLSSLSVGGQERIYELPSIPVPVGAIFGGQTTLLGLAMPEVTQVAGEELVFVLYWRAEQRMDTRYTVFAHLLGPTGTIWGQQDNEPVAGSYPTTGWLPGEIVRDEYALPIDVDAPSGEYLLAVGLYDANTGQRLPVTDAEG
ncbi:MAG: phospholipid carrier-dependent glycosyltransferase, partial [Anaerolineae bacterium]|nr:phospholipid carrier-dependent glycosyltransferase [Anaerolineae bacterium]